MQDRTAHDADDLRRRTKSFALGVIEIVRGLPHAGPGGVLGRQLLRAATSIGANYRAVCLPRSDADFVAKLGIVIEECDESAYWLELLVEAGCVQITGVRLLLKAADELTRIFVASRETARRVPSARMTDQTSTILDS